MDDADISDARIEIAAQDAVNRARNAAESIPVGIAGECIKCGEDWPRLVNGWCCFCRDKYKMKYQ